MAMVSPKRALVYGFGVNDANYRTSIVIGGKKTWCVFFTTWKNMLRRCYDKKFQEKNKSYRGCEVVAEWRRFMAFREWMSVQQWRGMHIDKDLIGDGKVYGPEACVFISRSVNAFIAGSGCNRRSLVNAGLPRGVCFRDGRFRAQINVAGKKTEIGCYKTPSEAHAAWASAKAKMAFQLAESQCAGSVADALRQFGIAILEESKKQIERVK